MKGRRFMRWLKVVRHPDLFWGGQAMRDNAAGSVGRGNAPCKGGILKCFDKRWSHVAAPSLCASVLVYRTCSA